MLSLFGTSYRFMTIGVARNLCWRGLTTEGVEGEGYGASPADYWVWGSVVSSPALSRAEPRPKTSFGVQSTNTPDSHKSVIFDIYVAYI